jgi:hypothetical protein
MVDSVHTEGISEVWCFRESDAIIWQSSSHLPAEVDDFDKDNIIISESIATWRTFCLFTCATLGSGAALGGLITLAGVVANLRGARSDIRSIST